MELYHNSLGMPCVPYVFDPKDRYFSYSIYQGIILRIYKCEKGSYFWAFAYEGWDYSAHPFRTWETENDCIRSGEGYVMGIISSKSLNIPIVVYFNGVPVVKQVPEKVNLNSAPADYAGYYSCSGPIDYGFPVKKKPLLRRVIGKILKLINIK